MKKDILVLLGLFLFSCTQLSEKINKENYMIGATLWSQNAGEVKALYHQGFNAAKNYLKYFKVKKNKAIVLDIDETVLDNSPYQARQILNGKGYSRDSWGDWIKERSANALPGALEFTKWAAKAGYKIFYISNRKIQFFDDTLNNLKSLGFPIDKEFLLLKTTSESKRKRRDLVMRSYKIVCLIGDALGDFEDIFENKSLVASNNLVENRKKKFGTKFIMMPNPMYGAWERAIYKYKNDTNAKEKRRLWIEHLFPNPLK